MRVPGSGWSCDKVVLPLELENSSVDYLQYSDEGGECDAASFVETVDDLLPSHINDELEEERSSFDQQETYATCYFNGAVKVNKPSWCGVTSQVAEQED
ncbi:hypothetical protein AVEN_4484-1 [Araneus ventricosus]|uniref:Uncharacterized protein n=1 Tax=Araneus ventricosus TaxID=182803 RepID=A0A4Y2BM32_ARAVE|nr:hypothetical protein AVEN_4484-1 [Araneus ventricosus]